MRTRLTVAILVLVAATLIVTSLGSYLLVRRAAVSTAQQELVGQGRAISQTISGRDFPTEVSFRRELRIIKSAGDFEDLAVVELHGDGTSPGPFPRASPLPSSTSPPCSGGTRPPGTPGSCWSSPPCPRRSPGSPPTPRC